MRVEYKSLCSVPTPCHSILKIFSTKPILRMYVWNIWEVNYLNIIIDTLSIICIAIEMKLKLIGSISLCHLFQSVYKMWSIFRTPFSTYIIYSHLHLPHFIVHIFKGFLFRCSLILAKSVLCITSPVVKPAKLLYFILYG